MKWHNPLQIVVGSMDHTIKLVNVERKNVEEVLLTNHKVPTCLDTI